MNIGWQEIVLIMVFALLVFGPKRLPEIGRQVGRAIREVRRVSGEFEREIRDAVEPLERDAREAIEPLEREARAAYALDDEHSSFLAPPHRDPASEPSSEPPGSDGQSPAAPGGPRA